MAKVAEIVKSDSISNGKPTLVRRVSDMFKDGTYSGPPSLFRHTSMQKIRHCCQNLNLLPYLLYSVDNSKSHTINRKVNVCLRHLLRSLTERIFLLYRSLRQTVLRGISAPPESSIIHNVDNHASRHLDQEEETINKILSPKFQQFQKQKRKQNCPLLLTLAIYLAPLVLAFQLIVVFGLMIFEPYTPGFVFLISATMFIGCITMKILFHDTVSRRESISQRKKTQ